MRKYFFIFLLFLISNLANASNYYEDALSKYDLKDFKSSIQLLEKSVVFNPKDSESVSYTHLTLPTKRIV